MLVRANVGCEVCTNLDAALVNGRVGPGWGSKIDGEVGGKDVVWVRGLREIITL